MPLTTETYFHRSKLLPHVEMRRANQSAACYHTHSHDEYSVGVIDAGTASYRNRQQQARIHAGMTVMINPGDAHSCNPDGGQRWSYRMLFLDARWMADFQRQALPPGGDDYGPFARICSAEAASKQAFDTLFQILEQGENPLAADEALICFLMAHGFDRVAVERPRVLPRPALARARSLILDQLAENITLAELAAASESESVSSDPLLQAGLWPDTACLSARPAHQSGQAVAQAGTFHRGRGAAAWVCRSKPFSASLQKPSRAHPPGLPASG